MANRSVKYSLIADLKGFTGPMKNASESVAKFGDDLMGLDRKGQEMRQGLDTLGNTAGKIGLVAAGGLGMAVKKAADFDEAMSLVQSATHESAANMELLSKAALDAGADTAFSATEAAGAIEELAKAGVSTKDVLAGGLSGALSLAAAGELEVGEAAEIAASAMTQFALKGTDVEHIADLLAAGAGKAQGSVRDLGQALDQSGLVASQVGVSIEETTGTLSAFASAGLIGSDAGTSFKTMLLNLTPQSKRAATMMKELGLSAYDANGEFVGMAEYAGRLRTALKGMSDEQRTATLKQLFGNDAIRAANVLYNQGEKGIAKWTDEVNESGYAAETAATKMDNLKGDWEELTGALETALIGTGTSAQGPLRTLVQGLTDAVNAYNDLGDGAKTSTAVVMGGVALIGGSVFTFSQVVQSIAATREAMQALGATSLMTGQNMSRASKMGLAGAGGMVAGLSLMADESTTAGRAIESLGLVAGGALMGFAVGGPIGGAVGGLAGAAASAAKALWDTGDAAKAAGAAAENYKPSIDDLASTYDRLGGAASTANREIVLGELQKIDGLLGNLQRAGVSRSDAISAVLGDPEAARRVGEAIEYTNEQAALWHETADFDIGTRLGGAALAAEQGLDTLGVAMDKTHAKAIANALAIGTWKAEFPGIPKRVLTEMDTKGVPESRAEVKSLVDQMELTPKQIKSVFELFGYKPGKQEIADLRGDLNTLDKKHARPNVTVDADVSAAVRAKRLLDSIVSKTVRVTTLDEWVRGGERRAYADGGRVVGPGTGTSDSIPALVSNGEYVIKAKAVDHYGPALFDRLNAMRFADGGLVGSRWRESSSAFTGQVSRVEAFGSSAQVAGLRAEVAALRADLAGFERARAGRVAAHAETTGRAAAEGVKRGGNTVAARRRRDV